MRMKIGRCLSFGPNYETSEKIAIPRWEKLKYVPKYLMHEKHHKLVKVETKKNHNLIWFFLFREIIGNRAPDKGVFYYNSFTGGNSIGGSSNDLPSGPPTPGKIYLIFLEIFSIHIFIKIIMTYIIWNSFFSAIPIQICLV